MNRFKTVIIDDEKLNRELIIKFIMRLNPNYDIIAEADDVLSGFNTINAVRPDVVFLDIKMPGGTGFDLLRMFQGIGFEVVFITGFDEYALKAFEFNAVDYVLKPVNSAIFEKTLQRVQARLEKKEVHPADLKQLISSYDINKLVIAKIPVHTGNKVVLLDIEDLVFIRSNDGCTVFCDTGHQKLTSSKQISDFDFILESHPYIVKANKGTYINLRYVTSYSKGAACMVTMKDGTLIEISRRKKTEILKLLSRSEE